MTERFRYWTREFAELLVEELNRDESFQKTVRKFRDTIVLVCLDTPDGLDVTQTIHIDHGRVTQELEISDAPSRMRTAAFDKKKMMARTTAPYAVWCKLDRGEMNVLQALASPDHKVEGNKLKIAASMGVLNAMSATAARLPKDY